MLLCVLHKTKIHNSSFFFLLLKLKIEIFKIFEFHFFEFQISKN